MSGGGPFDKVRWSWPLLRGQREEGQTPPGWRAGFDRCVLCFCGCPRSSIQLSEHPWACGRAAERGPRGLLSSPAEGLALAPPVGTPLEKQCLPITASRRHAVQARAVSSRTSAASQRRPRSDCDQASGDFFVDKTCIDCDTCRWMCPSVFQRVGGASAVTRQPGSAEERLAALQALLACPTCVCG